MINQFSHYKLAYENRNCLRFTDRMGMELGRHQVVNRRTGRE